MSELPKCFRNLPDLGFLNDLSTESINRASAKKAAAKYFISMPYNLKIIRVDYEQK